MTRRQFLGVAGGCLTAASGLGPTSAQPLAATTAPSRSGTQTPAPARYACVGCFTSASRKARGEGLAVFRVGESGRLDPLQIIPSIPPAWTSNNTASGIVVSPSGRFVYASNRGHDSVGAFAIDAATGVLSPVGWEASGGTVPRFIGLDPSGTRLYAANQGSDTIVEFKVDEASGRLARTGLTIATGTPVCVVFW